MTTADIISAANVFTPFLYGICAGLMYFTYKTHGRITTLEAKPKTDYENRITTLEANADNHLEMIKEHRQESKEFRKALEQNTIAISELTTLITLIKNKL